MNNATTIDPTVQSCVDALNAAHQTYPQHRFINSLLNQFAQRKSLSQAQIGAANKVLLELTTITKELVNAPELPEGRYEIIGAILSHKIHDGKFGPTRKMVIKLSSGNRVYGTIPKAIKSPEPGKAVRFFATVSKSPDDPHFGFYAFPSIVE